MILVTIVGLTTALLHECDTLKQKGPVAPVVIEPGDRMGRTAQERAESGKPELPGPVFDLPPGEHVLSTQRTGYEEYVVTTERRVDGATRELRIYEIRLSKAALVQTVVEH